MDYRQAGVDRDKAHQAIVSLKDEIEKRYRPEICSRLGGYAAAFEIPASYRQPLILSTTDGVGTKLILAEEFGQGAYQKIAQDLVGMCVNDLLAARAEPIAFLDYVATGRLDETLYQELILGVAKACEESLCSLVGGETAEMPGFYIDKRMDMAGFAVGVCEKAQMWKSENLEEGQIVLGAASSGFHSNGFSLIRRIMAEQKWTLETIFEGRSLGEALLEPTRLYVKELLSWVRHPACQAAVHITGGGLVENLPRVLPVGSPLGFEIDRAKIRVPDLMRRFCEAGSLNETEAFSTFNMGIGFCVVVDPASLDQFLQAPCGFEKIGRVQKQDRPFAWREP